MGLFDRFRGGSVTGAGRRSGPPDEEPWWDPGDQAFAERPMLARPDLGNAWIPAPMWNNVERIDPYGDDPHGAALRQVRTARRLTALDEGAAWRKRKAGSLIVLRIEVFADAAEADHRAAWREHGAPCLDALWRERWRERDREPGWIEARWRQEPDRPAPFGPLGGEADASQAARVDWLVVEDHTGAAEAEATTSYQHVTLWAGRAHATLIARHDQPVDLDETVGRAASALLGRLLALPA